MSKYNDGTYRFIVLDGMRGIAALMVLFYHYFKVFDLKIFTNTFLAVDFFFILSGFVIYHSYADKIRGGMLPIDYITRRIARLFPMMATSIFFGLPAFYYLTKFGHSNYTNREILASVFTNLTFFPYLNDKTILSSSGSVSGLIFPVDPPLWSICFEMFASVIFISLIKLKKSVLIKLCLIFFALTIAAAIFNGLLNYGDTLHVDSGWQTQTYLSGLPRVLYGFICGIIICKVCNESSSFSYLSRFRKIPSVKVWMLYLILAVLLLFPFETKGLFYFSAISVLAPTLIIFAAKLECHGGLMLSLSKFLGWLSYPIYCLHKPVLTSVQIINEHFAIINYSSVYIQFLAAAVTLLLAIGISLLLDAFVQKPFAKTLQKVFQKIYA